MGRYTMKLRAFEAAMAERARVRSMPRDEYAWYISEHPEFRSSDAQLHSDAELLTMRAVEETLGKDAALDWAHRNYWQAVGARWRADNLAAATSRVEAFGLTLLFNGVKYGAVLAVAYLMMSPVYFAVFLPTFTTIVLVLAVFAAMLRKVL